MGEQKTGLLGCMKQRIPREGALGIMDGMCWRDTQGGATAFRRLPLTEQHLLLAKAWMEKGKQDKTRANALKVYEIYLKEEKFEKAIELAKKYWLGDEKVKEAAVKWYDDEMAYKNEKYYNEWKNTSHTPFPKYENVWHGKNAYDYLNAARIAKTYGLGQKRVDAAGYKFFKEEIPDLYDYRVFEIAQEHGIDADTVKEAALAIYRELRDPMKALDLAEKYKLGPEKVKKAALWLYQNTEGHGDKIEIAKKYGLGDEKITDAAQGLHRYFVAMGYFDEAGEVAQEYKINEKIVLKTALDAYDNALAKRELRDAIKIAEAFGLGDEKIMAPALKLYLEAMDAEYPNHYHIKEMTDKYAFDIEQVKAGALDMYNAHVKKKEYWPAIRLAYAAKLGDEKVKEAALHQYEDEMANAKYEWAIHTAEKYGLGDKKLKEAQLMADLGK